jgi:hypothetical protein
MLEYLSRHPEGYRYTQFCAHFHAWQLMATGDDDTHTASVSYFAYVRLERR